jgi:hypothetical protein
MGTRQYSPYVLPLTYKTPRNSPSSPVDPQAEIPIAGSSAAPLGLLDVQLPRVLGFSIDPAGRLGREEA